jgi:predicted nucleotidyltransferase
MENMAQVFHNLRSESRWNENILGFVVVGSRGRGFENPWSDYDFAVFVTQTAFDEFEEKYKNLPPGGRLYLFTIESFRERAAWNGHRHWERYTWAHLSVENDRTNGQIKRMADEKACVPEEIAEDHLRQSLRWYFNQVYHSLKNYRAGNQIGHRMEAAEGIRPFLEAVFCLHDRRLVPYYKYLRWELRHYPLNKLQISTDQLLASLSQILTTGDPRGQQKLFHEAQRMFTDEGYGEYFKWNMPTIINGFTIDSTP